MDGEMMLSYIFSVSHSIYTSEDEACAARAHNNALALCLSRLASGSHDYEFYHSVLRIFYFPRLDSSVCVMFSVLS